MAQLYCNLKAPAAFNQVHSAISYVDELIQYLEHHQ